MASLNIEHLLAARNRIIGNVREAASLLAEATGMAAGTGLAELTMILGADSAQPYPEFDQPDPHWASEAGLATLTKDLDSTAWKRLLANPLHGPKIAPGRRAILEASLADGQPPAFTAPEIERLFEPDPTEAAPDQQAEKGLTPLERLLLDAFKNLSWSPHTNRPRSLQPILGLRPVLSWGGVSVDHETADSLDALEGALTLLDGKEHYDARHAVYALLSRARDKKLYEAKTSYLAIHWTSAGDGHAKFLRPDLMTAANTAITDLIRRKPWLVDTGARAAQHDRHRAGAAPAR